MITPSLVTGRAWPPNPGPMTEIQPFTYEDGITFADLLYDIKNYIQRELVPYINTFPTLVDAAIAQMIADVTAALEAQDGKTDAKIAELTEWVEAQVNAIINNSIEVQDPVVAGLLETAGTDTRAAYDILTEEYRESVGDKYTYDLDHPAISGETDDDRYASALALFRTFPRAGTLKVSRNTTITRTMTIDTGRMSVDFQGNDVNAAAVGGNVAILLTNTFSDTATKNSQTIKNAFLIGPGQTVANSIGVRHFSAAGGGHSRDYSVEGFDIRGFENGMSYGKNSYLIRHRRVQFRSNKRHCRIESSSEENTNYGEQYSFIECVFGSGSDTQAFWMDRADADVNVFASSFDFLQSLALITNGQLSLYGCHVELRDVIPGPIVDVGPSPYAQFMMDGGKIMHSGGLTASNNPTHYFRSRGTSWGGGITLNKVFLQMIYGTSGFLCDGPGAFRTSDIVLQSGTDGSGYGQGTILTSQAKNLLRDPGFTLTPQIDAYIRSSAGAITSKTSSADVDISNVNGRLRLRKKTTAAASVEIRIPIQHGKFYGNGFTLATYVLDTPGSAGDNATLQYGDLWFASRTSDSNGVPVTDRIQSRPSASWAVSTLPNNPKLFSAIGADMIPRLAPLWADSILLRFTISNLQPGIYDFAEVIVTEL